MDFPGAHQRSQVKVLQVSKLKKENLLKNISIFEIDIFWLYRPLAFSPTCQYFAFTFKTEIFAYNSQDGFQQKNFRESKWEMVEQHVHYNNVI